MTRRSRSWIASWPAKPATGKPWVAAQFKTQNSKFKTQNSKFSSLLHWTRRSLIPDPYSTHPPKPYGRAAPFLNAVRLYTPPFSSRDAPRTTSLLLRSRYANRTGIHPFTQALRAGYVNTPIHPSPTGRLRQHTHSPIHSPTHALGPDLPKSHYIIGFRHSRVTELWEQGDGRLAGD
jgi:hypothetical protein